MAIDFNLLFTNPFLVKPEFLIKRNSSGVIVKNLEIEFFDTGGIAPE